MAFPLSPHKSSGQSVVLVVLVVLAIFASSVRAQQPPSAGSLQRDAGQALQPPAAQREPGTAAKPEAAPRASEQRILVQRFAIDGATLIPPAELEAQLAGETGKELSLAQLEAAARKIAQHYRSRGWYVRALVPPQEVRDGIVHIRVIEAHYGSTRLEQQGDRARGDFIERMVLQGHAPGDALSATRLERGILLASDLPGVRASAILEPGAAAGITNINLRVQDTPLLTGDASLNNFGVRSAGRVQLLGGIALNDPSGYGDQINLRALTSGRLTSGSLGYSIPLGTGGVRLAAQASHLNYRLGGQFKPLDARGSADTLGLSLSWAWIRQADRNLSLSLGAEGRSYADDMLGAPIRRHRVRALGIGLSGDLRDSLGGGGITWGSVRYTTGRLGLHSVAADIAADRAGPRAAGHYNKIGLALNRLQNLGQSGFRLFGSVRGQLADRNLASSEQFSLGGPDGVRAYPVSEATGDQGALLRVELQRPFANGWQLAAFADTGYINQHRKPWPGWAGGLAQPNSYQLSGVGLSLSWIRPGDWAFNATAAFPIGGNPGRNAAGRNSDGSSPSKPRFWLSASKVF